MMMSLLRVSGRSAGDELSFYLYDADAIRNFERMQSASSFAIRFDDSEGETRTYVFEEMTGLADIADNMPCFVSDT